MDNFSQLLLYIPGIIIFLVGSGQTRTWLRSLGPGGAMQGTVLKTEHVVKKDAKGRETFDYYNTTVEYRDQKGHMNRNMLKSPVEYAAGQRLIVTKGPDGNLAFAEAGGENLFHPLVMMIGGALLIILALEENRGHEVPAMACLAAVLAGAGISLVWKWLDYRKRRLQELPAVITGLYSRQISKESKIVKAARYTFYPVVRYTLDGKETVRRCNVNSEREKSFKVGDTITLYYDPETGDVLEKNARLWMLIAGALLAGAGILAGVSILSVL